MRFHPAVYHNFRQAVKDDVLPLSRSITTTAGEILSELPIPKGLKVILSISGYNRSVDTLLSIRIVGAQGLCCLFLALSFVSVIPICMMLTAKTGIKRFSAKTQIFSIRKDGSGIMTRSKNRTLVYMATCESTRMFLSLWLDLSTRTTHNLPISLTFAGGIRTCIGWRFALYEVQSLTVEIINYFDLSPTPEIEKLRREACLVMIPTLEGEQLSGENLPLKVSFAPRDWFGVKIVHFSMCIVCFIPYRPYLTWNFFTRCLVLFGPVVLLK